VHVREIGPRRADVVREVRRQRNEGLVEVIRLLRSGGAVVEGALVEAEQVQLVLTDLGASVALSRQG
jgi:ribosomal protein L7/L12